MIVIMISDSFHVVKSRGSSAVKKITCSSTALPHKEIPGKTDCRSKTIITNRICIIYNIRMYIYYINKQIYNIIYNQYILDNYFCFLLTYCVVLPLFDASHGWDTFEIGLSCLLALKAKPGQQQTSRARHARSCMSASLMTA